jgi:hypothetical protein
MPRVQIAEWEMTRDLATEPYETKLFAKEFPLSGFVVQFAFLSAATRGRSCLCRRLVRFALAPSYPPARGNAAGSIVPAGIGGSRRHSPPGFSRADAGQPQTFLPSVETGQGEPPARAYT